MDTFPDLLLQQTKARPLDPAFRYKRYGLWKTWTWGDIGHLVRELTCGLASKGLKANDKVAVIGNNIPQLYFGMIATQCLGALPVPIHPDSNAEELTLLLNDCEAKFTMVQDQQQVDALYEVKQQCPKFEEMIYSDGRGMQEYTSSRLHSFAEIQKAGKKFAAEHPDFFAETIAGITQDTDAFILYTSGTAGPPRGAVHTHGSLIQTAKAFADQESIRPDEEVLVFMPLSYPVNTFFTYTLWLVQGFTASCPESNETVMTDLHAIGPTIIYAPPHFYKQLYADIIARSQRSGSRWFSRWFTLAQKNRGKFLNGDVLSTMDNLKWLLGNVLMYSPLKNVFGLSKLRKAFTGGDIMSTDVFNFLRSVGIHIKKTYGTTEGAGIFCVQGWQQLDNPGGEFIMGKPLPGVEISKLDSGEIAFKGINAFREYYRNPEATAAVKGADGWVKTGDMGDIDSIGALKITDRVDSIGRFSNGDTFAPHPIENALKSSPFIKEAVAVGAGQDAIAAFIVIDKDTVGGWAEMNDIRFTSYRDLAAKDEVYELVKKTVAEVNVHIEQIEGQGCPPIKRFLIMHREFNVDAGEITRSRKIKRDVVMSKHRALVDALYSPQQKYAIKDTSSGETIAELKLESADLEEADLEEGVTTGE